jgi:hypothetical protein
MDAAKLVEAVKPSPLIERSVKFSGGPKVQEVDKEKKQTKSTMKKESNRWESDSLTYKLVPKLNVVSAIMVHDTKRESDNR